MRKLGLILLCLMMSLSVSTSCADGVTLKTVSTFAGSDAAADIYTDLLKQWQEKTGNTVIDSSATSDEAWKTGVLKDFAAGNEADVLFFFTGTPESASILHKVVPIADLNAAYTQYQFPISEQVAEADGQIYTIPVRPYWEGLFCNIDLFEQYGLELPTTWNKLEKAIVTFKDAGIVPISVSLSDVPHYLAEFSILSCGSPEEYSARPGKGEQVPQSWIDGMYLVRKLYQMGAFAKDANATTEAASSDMFKQKKAAMQIDGSWFANSLSEESMETTVVLPFPALSQKADKTTYLSGVSMGFYLSRAAWKDDKRRDAAVDLLHFLSTGKNAEALGVYNLSGRLKESYDQMRDQSTTRLHPIQDDMAPEARLLWLHSMPDIADGTADPKTMWKKIMELDPFGANQD